MRDAQVSRGALKVLQWFASEQNAWRRFIVTERTSAETSNAADETPRLMEDLGLSRNTIGKALIVLINRGYLEEHKPRNARQGEREARLSLGTSSASAR